jgi:hypothetical protein
LCNLLPVLKCRWNLGYNTYIHGNVITKLPVKYLIRSKGQEGKTGPVWGLVPVEGGRI